MKHLVYAILREADAENGPFPEGIESRPVVVVTDAGLAAAFSEVPPSPQPLSPKGRGEQTIPLSPAAGERGWGEGVCAPEVPRLLAYARVIEALSRRRVVLPLRYGCLLDTEAQIRELLRRRCRAFHAALEELDGCVEMGLRILLPEKTEVRGQRSEVRGQTGRQGDKETGRQGDKEMRAGSDPVSLSPGLLVSLSPRHRGVAYLAQRNRYYAQKDGGREEVEATTEQIKTALAGLFVNCRSEAHKPDAPAKAFAGASGLCSEASARNRTTLLSLYFLVRSENVERFREACHRLQQTFPGKVLLTGPWVPYNFVGEW